MIFCHECKVEEMIDFSDAEDWRCPKCNQPERLNPKTLFKGYDSPNSEYKRNPRTIQK
jgi:NAD-dependent SIR2 family protein deacetylase